MKLSECKIGTIVTDGENIGHISGIVHNGLEYIPVLTYCEKKHSSLIENPLIHDKPIHHGYLSMEVDIC